MDAPTTVTTEPSDLGGGLRLNSTRMTATGYFERLYAPAEYAKATASKKPRRRKQNREQDVTPTTLTHTANAEILVPEALQMNQPSISATDSTSMPSQSSSLAPDLDAPHQARAILAAHTGRCSHCAKTSWLGRWHETKLLPGMLCDQCHMHECKYGTLRPHAVVFYSPNDSIPNQPRLTTSFAPHALQTHIASSFFTPPEIPLQAPPVPVVKEEEGEGTSTNLAPAPQQCSHCDCRIDTSRPSRSRHSNFLEGGILCGVCSAYERAHGRSEHQPPWHREKVVQGQARDWGLALQRLLQLRWKHNRPRPQALIDRAQAQRLK
ncbi:hypothetical protein B0H17DRAFT_1145119 [Mycena rosella]|uniref:GATA-type domain-containing protein n=1 Tax=Mycena rosella TaxID=1033263 RepID=A0AAD7CRT5_MYCRO|nr:hypothetical protein B0H17DRAFT_1145119 [Mycena rosella]